MKRLRTDGRYERSKFDRYVDEQLGEHELELEILTWWKMNAHRYPILACLARDLLARSIYTVASESAFSVGGCHLDSFRNSFTLKVMFYFFFLFSDDLFFMCNF